MEPQDLTTDFEDALYADGVSAFADISSRRCHNDEYEGIQYTFTGEWIDVPTIISVVSQTPGHRIDELYHKGGPSGELGVFVAVFEDENLPAFTP